MIKEILLQPVRQILICKLCKTQMEFTGMALKTNPPTYPHWCKNDQCAYRENADAVYPRTYHVEIKSAMQ